MEPAKTYLVPIDFSKTSGQALSYAIRFARDTGGKLLLVHAITDSPAYVPVNLRTKFYADLEQRAERHMQSQMRRRLRGEAIEYSTLTFVDDDAARAIADQAKKSRVAMIIMGSHGRTGVERFVLGSVAEKIIRYARCPVLIVK